MKNRKKVLSFLLAGVLTLGCFPVTAGATNNSKDGTKPADGTTVEQPFPKTLFLEEHNSSKGFTRFRIPALVTAGNGALIAATDIRWDIAETEQDWIRQYQDPQIMEQPGLIR